MKSITWGGLLCLAILVLNGCSAGVKPTIRRDAAPTVESIGEFLDVIQLDELVDRFMGVEKKLLDDKLSKIRARSHLNTAQSDLREEFIGKAMSIVDQELTPMRFRQLFKATIQASFSQRDVDALTTFYRSQSGKAIIAEVKSIVSPYVQERQERKELIGADIEHDIPNQFSPILQIFRRAADSHQLSQFYGADIDHDITSKLLGAQNRFEMETEPLQAEMQFRLQELKLEYQTKLKLVANP